MKEINKRDMKLSDHNISRAKHNELKYFCMQYEEKRRELESYYGLRALVNDGMPMGNCPENLTEEMEARYRMLQKDIELVEQTAMEADESIYCWLLKNVTQCIPYEWLDVPMSRNRFYDSRKYFFYLMAQKR